MRCEQIDLDSSRGLKSQGLGFEALGLMGKAGSRACHLILCDHSDLDLQRGRSISCQ